MRLIIKILFITTTFTLSKIFADCSDLDYSDCLYWSSDCEWNEDSETCQYIGGGDDIEYGPYEFTSISESDGMRDGALYFDAELYFPLNYPGMLKSIVLGAGHGDSGESMYYWASLLASHGFIATTIDYNDPLNESHYQRGLAMLDLIETVKQENNRSSSPVFGQVDTSKFALIGSSMSGGAIIEAAISDSVESLDALISLNPTVIFEDCDLCAGNEHCICLVPEFLEEQDVPIMIISGENETNDIGYEGMLGIDIYLNHPDSTTKLLYEILDGGHSSAIPHIEPVRMKVINWLKFYLNDDTQVCSELLEEPDNHSQFLTNFECEGELLSPVIYPIGDQEFLEDENDPNLIEIIFDWTENIPEITVKSDIDTSVLSFQNEWGYLYMGHIWISYEAQEDWYGSANVEVTMTYENSLSDTVNFVLNILPVNDPPESFSIVYPTITDTISISTDTDEILHFSWEESVDVDSEVSYTTTVTLDYFGQIYFYTYESSGPMVEVSPYEWAVLMTNLELERWTLEYTIHASDEEYSVETEGEFVFQNNTLSVENDITPLSFRLHQNYPNPFNPITTIRYELPEDSFVDIAVYDMLGNLVKNLINANQLSGYKAVQWNATNNQGEPVSAGVYLYKIQASNFIDTKKMIFLK